MNIKSLFLFFFISLTALNVNAGILSLTEKEQQQILIEADNWMDEMPEGLDDRLSDAVNHAIHGFYSEIELYRNLADTLGLKKYKVKVEDIQGGKLGEIPMRLYSSTSNSTSPLLIYFHGGGWSLGALDTSDKFCRALAAKGNIKIISVEYPLAPENPYPTGLKQCIEAVDFIFMKSDDYHFDPAKVSLGGDGSGGNLALETYTQIENEHKIKSLVLYYPLINSRGELDPLSKRKYGRGYGFDSRLWEAFLEAYNSNNSSIDKIQSLPPTLLISAGRDIIIEEGKNFSKAFADITYIQMDDALHGFITDGHQPTAFEKAVEFTDIFLTKSK